MLVREFSLPSYLAVKRYVPAASDSVDSVATPEEFKLLVPSTVESFMKLTVPVGEMVLPFTVAVRVNSRPAATGFGVADRLVVVDSAFTVTETADEVLVREFPLPPYLAVRLYVPGARDAVESVATPKEFKLLVPSSVEPFRKVTVPVGDTESFAVTLAVKTSA